MQFYKLVSTVLVVGILFASTLIAKENQSSKVSVQNSAIVDNVSYINTNKILMFITNHGNFGRDLSGIFARDYGTFYPYLSNAQILDGTLALSPLYTAGIWLGGKVDNQIRVTISEYSSEYTPGPMASGTFQTDRAEFKVYKLYADSLEANPNADYTNWPVSQGAPVDENGRPDMLGSQMLWSVYNDADPSAHTDMGTAPLGIEIQQTMWAADEAGVDSILINSDITVIQNGISEIVNVIAYVSNPSEILNHDYQVTFEDTVIIFDDTIIDPLTNDSLFIIDTIEFAWHLDNLTTGTRLLEWQLPNTTSPILEGITVEVTYYNGFFSSFEVVANANGFLYPSVPGALSFRNFPTPDNLSPGIDQQIGSGKWAFHTADNGGTSGDGTRAYYDDFLTRVLRNGNLEDIRNNDFEMRFTGSYENPGVGGSYAIRTYQDEAVFWVPFELWRIGNDTPNDFSDDVRMTIWIMDADEDGTYNLGSWGTPTNGSGFLEHSASSWDDDPFTDWIYWMLPADSSAGESGYLADETAMQAGTYDYEGEEVMARTVLINWNGGESPPFNQELPEQGTVFRLVTEKNPIPVDTFLFSPTPPDVYTTGDEGVSIYTKYKIYNKGNNVIEDMYFSAWSDPDLGGATDDFVGCDTLDDLFFCYNDKNIDIQYGTRTPSIGFKIIHGPVVAEVGEEAVFDDHYMIGYKNLKMSSFNKYFNGTDPSDFQEVYWYMQGLDAKNAGAPYIYDNRVLNYVHSGDPVTGTGDLDFVSSDRRMMASFGPFTFAPGDSQYVLIKMAIGQGTNRLSSITRVKEILNKPYLIPIDSSTCCIGYRGNVDGGFDDGSIKNSIDVGDLVYLVAYMFQSGPPLFCPEEGDVDASGDIDIGDLVYLVSFMFQDGAAPILCP